MKKAIKWMPLLAVSALTCMAFVACAPSTLEKAEEKLVKEGYKVQIETDMGDVKECKGALMATKTEEGHTDVLMAWLFDSRGAAKDYYNEYKDQLNEMSESSSPVLDGKWIYIGTSDAIEDFTD